VEERSDRAAGPATPGPDGRLPYEKPQVVWEQPLEAQPSLMSGCQKTPAQAGDCTAIGPPRS
jgi:hypothetical protein